MKKIAFLSLLIPFAATFALPVYADQSDCGSDPIHCAYLTGLTSDPHNGRWIQASFEGKTTPVLCMNNASTAVVSKKDAQAFRGDNTVTYSICQQQTGGCKEVGVDNFIVYDLKQGNYYALPKYYNINLSPVASQFTQCDPTQPQHLQLK